MVFVDQNVKLSPVLRNRCYIFRIREPWNVNVTKHFCVVLWVLGISCVDILWSIPLFSIVSNDDRGKYYVLTMCSTILHNFFLLIVFISNWFRLDKENRETALFIFYKVDGGEPNRCTFGHWFSVNVVSKSCICSMYKEDVSNWY